MLLQCILEWLQSLIFPLYIKNYILKFSQATMQSTGKKTVVFFWGILFSGIIIAAGLPGRAAAADDTLPVTVSFRYENQTHTVYGDQINEYTYVFNPGAPQKIKITTLDWPPYIGKNICKQGWVQQLTIAMLSSRGYEITCTFYPWARTVSVAEAGNADILYPEYYIEPDAPSDIYEGTKRLDHLALSDKIPGGPIAFIKRAGEKDLFNGDLRNLRGTAIGVVRGYQNTPEFDHLMDMNFFRTEAVTDDLTNVKMLIAGRVDLIIGDPAVIYYSIKNSISTLDEKQRILDTIETVTPIIQYNHLYYAVSKKRPGWEKTLEMLNQIIEEFKKSGELYHVIRQTNAGCGFEMQTLTGEKDI
jgi:polar amino acid transport system substrate-binding protein